VIEKGLIQHEGSERERVRAVSGCLLYGVRLWLSFASTSSHVPYVVSERSLVQKWNGLGVARRD
jgi:hypothetical protein